MSNNFDDTGVPAIKTLDDLIRELKLAFDKHTVDVNYVNDLMTDYKSEPTDWIKYAHFDQHGYTRNLVDNGNGKFNLIILCWSGGQASAIHDHSHAHCFMKVLSGSLHETRYAWPSSHNSSGIFGPQSEMKVTNEQTIDRDETAYINDSIGLHRMANRSATTPAVSLHLYSPPITVCQSFDESTGGKRSVTVKFHSKFGSRVEFRRTLTTKQNVMSY